MNDTTAGLGFTPRTFALHAYPDGGTPVIVAWGMTLPDGSALTIDWHSPSTLMAVCNSPERAALLHNAEVVWADQATEGPP